MAVDRLKSTWENLGKVDPLWAVLTDPDRPIDPDSLGAEGLERYDAAGRDAADEGLSFGFEVKRRPQFENRMRPDEDESPGLQDDFERLIEHSTLGVRGTYRF